MKRLHHVVALCVWLLAGCSLVVAGDPEIVCKGDAGCPSGQLCAESTGRCVAENDACDDDSCGAGQHCDHGTLVCIDDDVTEPDATPEDDAGEVDATTPDARRPDADAARPVQIGDRCSGQDDCARIVKEGDTVDGVCGTQPLTGAGIPSFCTVHCCSKADCPDSYFCAHGPNAGRYCVPFGTERAKPTGTKAAGADCTEGIECATGRCDYALPAVPTQKTCIDTCCNDADCGGGLVCGLRQSMDNVIEWVCREPYGTGAGHHDCSITGAPQCQTGACYGDDASSYCTGSCCSNASCTGLGLARCVSGSTDQGTTIVNICAENNSGKSAGAACASDTECQSNICANLKCAATCCTEEDCTGGQACIADGVEPRPHCSN